jgi:hypothetical protein
MKQGRECQSIGDIIYGIMECGQNVTVPDGRIGILKNFRLYEDGPKAPGRAVVQFLNSSAGIFENEDFCITGVTPIDHE